MASSSMFCSWYAVPSVSCCNSYDACVWYRTHEPGFHVLFSCLKCAIFFIRLRVRVCVLHTFIYFTLAHLFCFAFILRWRIGINKAESHDTSTLKNLVVCHLNPSLSSQRQEKILTRTVYLSWIPHRLAASVKRLLWVFRKRSRPITVAAKNTFWREGLLLPADAWAVAVVHNDWASRANSDRENFHPHLRYDLLCRICVSTDPTQETWP